MNQYEDGLIKLEKVVNIDPRNNPPALDEPLVVGDKSDNQPEKQQKKDIANVKEKKAPRERKHNQSTINNNHTVSKSWILHMDSN